MRLKDMKGYPSKDWRHTKSGFEQFGETSFSKSVWKFGLYVAKVWLRPVARNGHEILSVSATHLIQALYHNTSMCFNEPNKQKAYLFVCSKYMITMYRCTSLVIILIIINFVCMHHDI